MSRTSDKPELSWWASQSSKTQIALCLLFLSIIPFFQYSDVIFGGKQFFPHDIRQFLGGANSLIEASKEVDYQPLWASNMFVGMPAYTIHYPKSVPHFDTILSYLRSFLFPVHYFWVLLSGTFFFFYVIFKKPLASTLGAISVGFTTYIPIIIGAGHNTKFIAFTFIPWVLLGYYLIFHKRKYLLGLVFFSTLLMLQLRAGHPQVTYYFLIVMGIWWLCDFYFSYIDKTLNDFYKSTAVAALAVVLTLLAIAQPYWAMYEYAPYSIRGGSSITESSSLSKSYAQSWSQGLGELYTLLVPDSFGGSSMEGTYWGPKPVTSGPHYLGVLIFLFALFGWWKQRDRLITVFTLSGIITLLFSLGEHFSLLNSQMFDYFPMFNKFRTPEMWLIAANFSFSVVGVSGFIWVLNWMKDSNRDLKTWMIPLIVLIGLSSLFYLNLDFTKEGERAQIAQQIARQNQVSPSDPRVGQAVDRVIKQQLLPQRKEKARRDFLRFMFIVGISALLIYLAADKKIPIWAMAMSFVLLNAYDMISVGSRYIPDSAKVSDSKDYHEIMKLEKRQIDTFLQANVATHESWEYRVLPLLDNPFNNAVPSYYYPTFGGYSGAKLTLIQDIIDFALFSADGRGINNTILNLFNVKYVSSGFDPGPNYKQVYAGNDGLVFENENVLSKAFFVDSLIYAENPQEEIRYLNLPNFNPKKSAVVNVNSDRKQFVNSGTDTLWISRYEPNYITINYRRATDGFLVLSEMYYPAGWNASLNETGEKLEIIKTNFALRGLFVPMGEHEITLAFEPVSHVLGSRLSWVAIIFLFALTGLAIYRYARI